MFCAMSQIMADGASVVPAGRGYRCIQEEEDVERASKEEKVGKRSLTKKN